MVNFSVHRAKWVIPFYIVFILLTFVGAFFCWKYELTVFSYIILGGFSLLGIYGIAVDGSFHIEVDSSQISITRFLKGTKFYTTSDIFSCMILNNNASIIEIGDETINIDPYMVNAMRFALFAQGQAYLNAERRRLKYKITRLPREKTMMFICFIFFAGLYSFLLYSGSHDKLNLDIKYHIFCIAFIAFCLAWLIFEGTKSFEIDESKETIIYKRAFFKKRILFSEILQIVNKKRFLEENAVNFTYTYQDKNKTRKFKISSLDTNSSRLLSVFLAKEEEESYD